MIEIVCLSFPSLPSALSYSLSLSLSFSFSFAFLTPAIVVCVVVVCRCFQLRLACERFYETEELLRMRDLHIENLNQQVELHAKAIEERAAATEALEQHLNEQVGVECGVKWSVVW